MRIALCFYGQPRSVALGYEYFKKYFIDAYEVDVHAHLWDMDGISEFQKMYQPKSILVENQINFQLPAGIFGAEPHHGEPAFTRCAFNSISQAYSFYQACLGRIKYSKDAGVAYDLVVKARTDTTIYSLDMSLVDPLCYNVPSQPGGFIYNDVIAVCSEPTANVIGFKYNTLDRWYEEGIRDFIPESLNNRALIENNIQINRLNNSHVNVTGY